MHYAKNDFDSAIADYTAALRLDAGLAVIYGNRSWAYVGKGDSVHALADAEKALDLSPNDPEAVTRKKAVMQALLHDGDATIECKRYLPSVGMSVTVECAPLSADTKIPAERKSSASAEAVDFNIKEGYAYALKGAHDEAIAAYNKAIDIDPRSAMAFFNRAIAYSQKNELDRAIADYNKTIEIDPNMAAAYAYRGSSYYLKGDSSRALADLNDAIRRDPKQARFYTNRGAVYRDKGDFDRAIADHTKAIELDPKLPNAFYNRGLVYNGKGDRERAVADFQAVLALDPSDQGPETPCGRTASSRETQDIGGCVAYGRRPSAPSSLRPVHLL